MGKLTEVQETMDTQQYCDILDDGVVESFEKLEMPEDRRIFQLLHPLFSCLILSGAHYHLILIFHVYLVLPAFSAYQTFPLTQDYQDLNT